MFRTRETRLARNCAISYGAVVHMMCDGDGVLLEVPDGTAPAVHVDAVTEEMYAERGGRRYECVPVAGREGRGSMGARDRRDLQRQLKEMQREGAAREG